MYKIFFPSKSHLIVILPFNVHPSCSPVTEVLQVYLRRELSRGLVRQSAMERHHRKQLRQLHGPVLHRTHGATRWALKDKPMYEKVYNE